MPLMHAMRGAGADLIELGVPFSDPMADGPTIQHASECALKFNIGLRDVLQMVKAFRQTDVETPVVLMGYANPLEAMGMEAFASAAQAAGVDGVLTVDYPPEESDAYIAALTAHGLDPIFLVSPTTRKARVAAIVQKGRGFIYYVSLKGVTGAGHLDADDVGAKIAGLRRDSSLPIGVGFGIRDANTARAMSSAADAVIIGSRVIEELGRAGEPHALDAVKTLIGNFRTAIDASAVPHPVGDLI